MNVIRPQYRLLLPSTLRPCPTGAGRERRAPRLFDLCRRGVRRHAQHGVERPGCGERGESEGEEMKKRCKGPVYRKKPRGSVPNLGA